MALDVDLRRFILGRFGDRLTELNIAQESLADDFDLVESGLIDSLEFVNLIGEIETEFGLEVDLGDYDPEEFTTIGILVRCALGKAGSGMQR